MQAHSKHFLGIALLLLATPVVGQVGGSRGAGSTRGVGDTQWQTKIEIAQQELKEYEVQLQRMTEEQWKKNVLAWVAYDFSTKKRLTVDESYRVAGVDPGKRGEVVPISNDALAEGPPTAWDIAWGKKSPKGLTLTLTDTDSTQVDCALTPAQKFERGYIGIFVRDGVVLCVPRGPFETGDGPA